MEMPSKVLVPRPTSSSRIKLRRGRMMENIRRLFHLDHERRFAAAQRVGRADARENPVDDADLRLGAGDKTAHLREDHDQRYLAHVGRLARHIRPGEQHDLSDSGRSDNRWAQRRRGRRPFRPPDGAPRGSITVRRSISGRTEVLRFSHIGQRHQHVQASPSHRSSPSRPDSAAPPARAPESIN